MPCSMRKGSIGAQGRGKMDEPLHDKLRQWWEDIRVDGWVEFNDQTNLMHIELFPVAIRNLKLEPGDYVRIQVVHEEDLNETRP